MDRSIPVVPSEAAKEKLLSKLSLDCNDEDADDCAGNNDANGGSGDGVVDDCPGENAIKVV